MKWFKHMTASSDDERMANLINGGGVDGLAMYGAYWRIAEIIASQGTHVTYPPSGWAVRLGVSPRAAIPMLEKIHTCGLIELSFVGGGIRVEIPNLTVREDSPNRLPWTIWKVIRLRIFRRDNYVCRYCNQPVPNPECDHVVPVSRGGGHDDSNLVTACQPCNRRKSDKMVEVSRG